MVRVKDDSQIQPPTFASKNLGIFQIHPVVLPAGTARKVLSINAGLFSCGCFFSWRCLKFGNFISTRRQANTPGGAQAACFFFHRGMEIGNERDL